MPQIETYEKATPSSKGAVKNVTGSDTNANDQRALHTLSFGMTSSDEVLPVKVEDDGSGYGTLVYSLESFTPQNHDYIALTYNANDDIETVVFKIGGSGGTTVATFTLGYDGSDRLTSVTKTT